MPLSVSEDTEPGMQHVLDHKKLGKTPRHIPFRHVNDDNCKHVIDDFISSLQGLGFQRKSAVVS